MDQFVEIECHFGEVTPSTLVPTPRFTPSPVPPPKSFPTTHAPITPVPISTTLGSISGNVKADLNNDTLGDENLRDVLITLQTSDGNAVIATTLTDFNGGFVFDGVPPGNYVIKQTNLPDYMDVSDTDNTISVNLVPGEDSTGNMFVDVLPSAAPSL